jgi:hypothetical protein
LRSPYFQVLASGGPHITLDSFQGLLTELKDVPGLRRVAKRFRDNGEKEVNAILAELSTASLLRVEYPGCAIEFLSSRGDILVRIPNGPEFYVEVKRIDDLDHFWQAGRSLFACSLLDHRFNVFFNLTEAEIPDDDVETRRNRAVDGVDAWISVLDRKLMTGQPLDLRAEAEGISSYPFSRIRVRSDFPKFAIGGGPEIGSMISEDQSEVVARGLVRQRHLARIVRAISDAYRQLEARRGGVPTRFDQIRIHGCIPDDLRGMLLPHGYFTIMNRLNAVLVAWGITELVNVKLSAD